MPPTITREPRLRLPVQRQASPLQVDPGLPADPHLRALSEQIIARAKISFLRAAAGAEPDGDDPFRAEAEQFLATRSEHRRERYQRLATATLSSSDELRSIVVGRFRHLELRPHMAIPPMQVDREALRRALEAYREQFMKGAGGKPDPDLQAGLAFKKMRMFINEVHCFEETSEWSDSDEVNLGGMKIDPFGNSTVIDEFVVSSDFDEGETARPLRKFAGWNLVTEPVGFPYVYGAIVVMAEKDDGGFAKFLRGLWEKVGAQVTAAVAGAVGAAIGGAIGGVLGAVVGAIVGALIGWLISLFDDEDDIMGARVLTMTLASAAKSYYDWAKLTSAGGWPFTLNYKYDGSHYRVKGAYKVFTE